MHEFLERNGTAILIAVAVVLACLVAFAGYNCYAVNQVHKLAKSNCVQMTGQSIVLGVLAQSNNCDHEVYQRMSQLLMASPSTAEVSDGRVSDGRASNDEDYY